MGNEVLIGVTTASDAKAARFRILAGRRFVVGPCLNLEMLKLCKGHNIIGIPGAMTPIEILRAWETGADVVKVFLRAILENQVTLSL